MMGSTIQSEIRKDQRHPPQFFQAALRYLIIIPLSLLVVFAIISLSGTVGRLFGVGDRSGAWAILAFGILLALANAFLISRVGKTPPWRWAAAIASLVVVGVVGTLSARSAYLSTPTYIVESISGKAVALDLESKSAHFETRADLKILKDDIYEIFWGGLGGTGEITNVSTNRLNGDFDLNKTAEAGQWQLQLRFSKPPKRGELISFAFGFDIIGTEPDDKAQVVYPVTWPTQRLGITIEVPKQRPCKKAEAYSAHPSIIGVDRKEELPPLLSGDASQLQWSTSDAQEDRKYVVTCYQ
jgi:hypothetical protein